MKSTTRPVSLKIFAAAAAAAALLCACGKAKLLTATTNSGASAPAVISAATSSLSVNASSVNVGSGVIVTLTAKDSSGALLGHGGSVVTMSWAGGTSTFSQSGPVTATDVGDGTYTASFTGAAVGSAATFSATIDGAAAASTVNVTVISTVISAATSPLSVSSSTIGTGSNVTVTLTAKDSGGVLLGHGGSVVTMSWAGGTSTFSQSGPVTATDVGDGTYTAVFTGAAVGSAAIFSATIDGAAATSTVDVTVTAVVSAANSTLSANLSSISIGATVTLTLTAKDSSGIPLGHGGSSVAIDWSGGTSTFSQAGPVAATDHGDGTYTATFTGATGGTAATFSASVDGNAAANTVGVTVVPPVISAANSPLSVDTNSINVGSRVTVTVTAKDSSGNLLGHGGSTVVVSWSGGTSTFGPAASVTASDVGNGTYTAIFSGAVGGTAATFSATADGSGVANTADVTVVAAPPVLVASVGTTLHGSGVTGQRHMFYDSLADTWWLFYLDSADSADIKTIYNNGSGWQQGSAIALPAGKPHANEGSQLAMDYRVLGGHGILYVGYIYDGASKSVTEYLARVVVSGSTLTPGAWMTVAGPFTLSGSPLPALAHSVSILASGTVAVMSSALQANGNFYAVNSTTKDNGTTGVSAFSTRAIMAVVNNWARHSALFSMGGDSAISIADDVYPADNFSNDFYAGSFLNGTWTPSLPNENSVSTNYLLSSHLSSNIEYEDWAGLRVSDTEAELVSRDSYASGTFRHMRYNGTSWVAGNSIPALVGVQGTGLAMTTDGTNCWLFAIAGDAANSVEYVKWTQGVGWDASWTVFEGSTAVRKSITSTEVSDAYGTFEVTWTDSSGNIVTEPFY